MSLIVKTLAGKRLNGIRGYSRKKSTDKVQGTSKKGTGRDTGQSKSGRLMGALNGP
jgi:hypothetical protein